MGLVRDFEKYLYEILNLQVGAVPWKGEVELPVFLRGLYLIYEFSLLGSSCLAVVLRGTEEITPEIVSKHVSQVQKKWRGLCIYVCKTISSYNRKRLIERHISFVVPGNQCYLPDLGIDLREHFRKQQKEGKLFLNSATQAVVIHGLLSCDIRDWTPSGLAKELNYSIMTMSRAFDELESMEIGKITRKGRERLLSFSEDKKVFWNRVKSLMLSPVKKSIWLNVGKTGMNRIKKVGILSGLSALSHFSMLNPPRYLVYAVSDGEWKTIKETAENVPYPEDAEVEIEVWSYSPTLFAKEKVIDPFSLYLILQGNEDERIKAALEKFMGKIKW